MEVLSFQYLYVGLKALEVHLHLSSNNPLAPALAGFMKIPKDERPLVKAMAADAIRKAATQDEWKRYLLFDCLDAYFTLTPSETIQFNEVLDTERFQGTKHMIQTIFDKARQEGRDEEREKRRIALQRICTTLLRSRYSQVPEDLIGRVHQLAPEQLEDLATRLANGESIDEVDQSNQE